MILKSAFGMKLQAIKAALPGLALLVVGAGGQQRFHPGASASAERQRTTAQSKFYCNIKALTSAERTHHTQLTEKLMGARKEVVETEKGYEFQYNPSDISLKELADWVVAEGKCCPFFDFHIDLEREGSLLCLRLTGDQGIKEFIRAEFQFAAK
jgi:uncharacterized protein HemX